MVNIHDKTLQDLEFFAVLQQVSEYCITALGKTNSLQIKPLKEKEQLIRAQQEESNYITVKSPMIGTFYRKATPEKPAFVNVGDDIREGSVLCIIEAMKLFNEIESEVTGKIVKVLVDDNTPVEYDQPLFLVDPR